MPEAIILNKQFEFIMPLQKGYTADDGYYHIKFAISSGNPDLQGDQMTDNALDKMALLAKGLNVDGSKLQRINIDDIPDGGPPFHTFWECILIAASDPSDTPVDPESYFNLVDGSMADVSTMDLLTAI
jgi:hypothetical protein